MSVRRGDVACVSCPRLSIRAGTTVRHGERPLDHRVATSILGGHPPAPCLARQTGGTRPLPIHHKRLGSTSDSFARLPMSIVSGRSKEIDSIVVLALDEHFCIPGARLHQKSFREEIGVREGFVDAWERGTIGERRRVCFNVRHPAGKILIAGVGERDVVTYPAVSRVFADRASGSDEALMPSPAAGILVVSRQRRSPSSQNNGWTRDATPWLHGGNVTQPGRDEEAEMAVSNRLPSLPMMRADASRACLPSGSRSGSTSCSSRSP